MGSYIEENLARDEQIIIKAQVTWLSQFWYLLFGILFILSSFGSKSLVGVVVGGVLIAIAAIHVLTTELALTNRRIIAKSGLIRRNTIELKTNRVESLELIKDIRKNFQLWFYCCQRCWWITCTNSIYSSTYGI